MFSLNNVIERCEIYLLHVIDTFSTSYVFNFYEIFFSRVIYKTNRYRFFTKHFFQNYIYILQNFFFFSFYCRTRCNTYCNKKRKIKFNFRSSIVVLDRRSRIIIRSIIFSLNNVIERRVLFRLHAIVAKSFDRVTIISSRILFISRQQIFILSRLVTYFIFIIVINDFVYILLLILHLHLLKYIFFFLSSFIFSLFVYFIYFIAIVDFIATIIYLFYFILSSRRNISLQ